MRIRTGVAIVAAALIASSSRVGTQGQAPKPVLYVVGTSHLDSQWNWTVQDSIRRFVPGTFFENFDRFEKFPAYVFSYEGAIHYMWFKEYYPQEWARVRQYVAQGRWRVAGNWINAVDVNVPSPESLMRHALYAKRFFRGEFNKVSNDVYLPDCFGFGFALPSIARHSGLTAFTTQKLTWGSSYGIPFPIGRWRGVDGSEVVAALNPGAYVTKIDSDIAVDPKWSNDPTPLGNGRSVIYRLFGVGDIGGAPDAQSVEWLQKALANKNGAVEVRNTSVDQLANDLTAEERLALPVYTGELTMKTHGVGTHSSQAAMKKLNRSNELLADAAERASVAANWLTGLAYPSDRLREAWTRVLWHHFHDDITGTSIPQAYQFSWNDEFVSLNQFAGVLTSATSSVASMMDTQATGVPLVVYNPMASSRRDVVEAQVAFPAGAPGPGGRWEPVIPRSVRVTDRATGREVPASVIGFEPGGTRIRFLADMPSVGFKVFEVRDGVGSRSVRSTGLAVSTSSLENARYRVNIDANGDIASIFDKEARHELLKSPIRLEMRDDPSPDKPAWRILYETVTAPVREYPVKPVVRIVERGPVRVALEVTRQAGASTITQRISLSADGDRVDVENEIDWKSTNTLLKAAFPFAASNPKATYDLGLGTIQRGNNHPDAYEVPAQWWADITDTTGSFGAAVLTDSKYGWDKPADNVLRLTLLHSPRPGEWPRPFYQSAQDLGRHRFVYSIAGHYGDWRAGRVPMRAARLNQPLVAFQATSHPGALGRTFSLMRIDDPTGQIAVRALKKAEDSDEIVVRLQEQYGNETVVQLSFASPILSVRTINAAEEPLSDATRRDATTTMTTALGAYQPRSFAIRLSPPAATAPAVARVSAPLELPFNLDGITLDAGRADGNLDGAGLTIAGELWPNEIALNGVAFKMGSTQPGVRNILVPEGQTLQLPAGPGLNRLYILASAVGGDVNATMAFEGGPRNQRTQTILVREWQAPIGQWFSTLRTERMLRQVVVPQMRGQTWTERAIADDMVTSFDPKTGVVSGIDQIRQAFVKTDEIAWVGTHRHEPSGNQIYIPSYVFLYRVHIPAGATAVRLPANSKIRIFAATAVREPWGVTPAGALYMPEISRR
ncbi:MAG TPA: glycoside hydrolase family 38 C-terminal domain-containing protein [Vicinamibacterales bacterium]|nr:glycoside hydrolase family 38 C-terminal domain-containing protein [Vicinamibacterales bacterium]